MASDGAEESQPIPENLSDETVNILEQTVHPRGPALNLECYSSMAPGSIPATRKGRTWMINGRPEVSIPADAAGRSPGSACPQWLDACRSFTLSLQG